MAEIKPPCGHDSIQMSMGEFAKIQTGEMDCPKCSQCGAYVLEESEWDGSIEI